MLTRVKIFLHHHGDFSPESFGGTCHYIGGSVDINEDVDTNLISILDLEDFSKEYDYTKYDFIYF